MKLPLPTALPSLARAIILLLIFLNGTTSAAAQTLAQADSLYKQEEYAEAAVAYEHVLKREGASSVIYYNLGNAYYKDQQIPQAILAYERALLLNPSDRDARFNLEMARQKTIDKQNPPSQMFFVTWWKQLSCMAAPWTWVAVGLSTFVLMLLGLLFYAFSSRATVRTLGGYASAVLLFVSVVANLCLATQWRMSHHRDHAIVMAATAAVKSSPGENSTDLFLIHEGSRLRILDASMREWYEVEVEEGKQGWIRTEDIEVI